MVSIIAINAAGGKIWNKVQEWVLHFPKAVWEAVELSIVRRKEVCHSLF
jgi:hypothetical protein